MSKDKRTYVLFAKNEMVEVSKDIYKEYYRSIRKERYMNEVSRNKHISLEKMSDDAEVHIDCVFATEKGVVEDEAINNVLMERVKQSLKLLSSEERWLIQEVFIKGIPLNELSKKNKVPQSTLDSRKSALLNKLYWMIQKNN